MSKNANAAYLEGGLTWHRDYGHRQAHLTKKANPDLLQTTEVADAAHLQECMHIWAKFIWRTSGELGNLPNIIEDTEAIVEEKRLISRHEGQAAQVIQSFEAANSDLWRMSFADDDLCMSIKCVFIFGKDALTDNCFWSID